MSVHSGHEAEDAMALPATAAARPLPLNSKRLTAALLRQLAGGLELPVTASPDELRQLIEGKLEEDRDTAVLCNGAYGHLDTPQIFFRPAWIRIAIALLFWQLRFCGFPIALS